MQGCVVEIIEKGFCASAEEGFCASFFLISNKDSLISKRERHPSTPGVYGGEQIKNEHYKNQENPK